MRLPRSVRRLRKTASAASAPAATNSAPPITNAPACAGPEGSGGGVTAFVDAMGLAGEMETNFVVVTGVESAGTTGLAGEAVTALV